MSHGKVEPVGLAINDVPGVGVAAKLKFVKVSVVDAVDAW